MNILNEMFEKLMNFKYKTCELKDLIWLMSEFDFKRLQRELEPIRMVDFDYNNISTIFVFGITIKITDVNEIMLVQRINK